MINFLRKIFCFGHDWEYEQSILNDEWVGVLSEMRKGGEIMEKLNFKYGLFLGALILANTSLLLLHIYYIAIGDSQNSVFNGVAHVIWCFIHAMWVDEALQD